MSVVQEQIKKSLIYLSGKKWRRVYVLIRYHKLNRGLKLRQQASLIYNKWWSLETGPEMEA